MTTEKKKPKAFVKRKLPDAPEPSRCDDPTHTNPARSAVMIKVATYLRMREIQREKKFNTM